MSGHGCRTFSKQVLIEGVGVFIIYAYTALQCMHYLGSLDMSPIAVHLLTAFFAGLIAGFLTGVLTGKMRYWLLFLYPFPFSLVTVKYYSQSGYIKLTDEPISTSLLARLSFLLVVYLSLVAARYLGVRVRRHHRESVARQAHIRVDETSE